MITFEIYYTKYTNINSLEDFEKEIADDLKIFSNFEETQDMKYDADTYDFLRGISWYILYSDGTFPASMPYKGNGLEMRGRWVTYDKMCEEIRELRLRLLAQ